MTRKFCGALLLTLLTIFMSFASGGNGVFASDDEQPRVYILSLAWSPDGSKVAVGKGTDSCEADPDLYDVQILDSVTKQVVQTLSGSECDVTDIDWSPDGKKIAVASIDGVGTRVWDTMTGQLSMKAQTGGQGIISVSWQPPDGLQLARAGVSNGIGILDPVTGETINLAPIGGTSVDWSPDGSQLVSGSGYDHQIYIADMKIGQQSMVLSGHTDAVGAVDWSPDGKRIASTGVDNTVRIWDAKLGEQLLVINASTVVEVHWSPDSQMVATASFDGVAQIWDASDGKLLDTFTYPNRVYAVDWSPDGTQLVYGGLYPAGQEAQVIFADVSDDFLTLTPDQAEITPES